MGTLTKFKIKNKLKKWRPKRNLSKICTKITPQKSACMRALHNGLVYMAISRKAMQIKGVETSP